MATLYTVEGEVKEVSPADGHSFTLKEMQDFVGGTVQIVPLPDGRSMLVNDEGKLIGLEYNEKASAEWMRQYPIEQYPLNNDQTIAGNALIASDTELGD